MFVNGKRVECRMLGNRSSVPNWNCEANKVRRMQDACMYIVSAEFEHEVQNSQDACKWIVSAKVEVRSE